MLILKRLQCLSQPLNKSGYIGVRFDLGVTLDFWKLRMRPGKPLMFGRVGETAMLGLPGNPVSAHVTFELFARPALRRMAGHARCFRRPLRGR